MFRPRIAEYEYVNIERRAYDRIYWFLNMTDLGQYQSSPDVQDISMTDTVESVAAAVESTAVREHDYLLPTTRTIERYSPSMSMLRLPEIEMHLWHITYRDQRGRYTGSNRVFDPRTTEIVRTILTEVVESDRQRVKEDPESTVSESTQSWWYRAFLRTWNTLFHRSGPTATSDADVFDVDTFLDHIQSYILRDYDIQRLDHQPETKHIEWKNLYWMGYAYHLHVVISRAEHPTLDLVNDHKM